MDITNRLSGKILECVNTIKGKETTRSTKSANRVSITGFVYDSLSKIVPDKKPPPTPKRDYDEDHNRPTEADDDPWGSDFDSDYEEQKDYIAPNKHHAREYNNNDEGHMKIPPVASSTGRRPVPPIPSTQKAPPNPQNQKAHRQLPPVPGQNDGYVPQTATNHSSSSVKRSISMSQPQKMPVDRFDDNQELEEYTVLNDEDILNYEKQNMAPPRPTRFAGPLASPSQPQILKSPNSPTSSISPTSRRSSISQTSPTSSLSPTSPTHRKFSLPTGDNNNNKYLPPVPKIPTPPTGHKQAATSLKSKSCSTLTPALKELSIQTGSDIDCDKHIINNCPELSKGTVSSKPMDPGEFLDRFNKFEKASSSPSLMPVPLTKTQTTIKKSQSFQTKPSFPSGESVDSGRGSDPPSPQLKIPSHLAPARTLPSSHHRNLPSSPPVPVSPPVQTPVSPTATTRLTSVGRPLPATPKDEEMESLYNYPWYHGDVSRDDTKKNLEKNATNGMFLVRKSAGTNIACPYALSLYQSGGVYNLHIRLRSDNKYALGMEKPDEPAFLKVPDLVTYFKSNTLLLSGQRAAATKLTTPAPKSMRH